MRLKFFIFLISLIIFSACQRDKSGSNSTETSNNQVVPEAQLSESGYKLLQRNCLICHTDKDLPHEQLIAPPMAAVKRRYTEITTSREQFVNRMTEFTLSPEMEEAVMYGAVRNFNLMLPVPIPVDTMRKIAAFIYENDIEAPGWFAEHYEAMHPGGQQPMPLELEEKINEINQDMRSAMDAGEKVAVDAPSNQRLKAMLETVNNEAEKGTVEEYHQLARDLRKMLPSSNSGKQAFHAYLEGLKRKLDLLEQSESKVDAEYVLLHLRKQLQMMGEHFAV